MGPFPGFGRWINQNIQQSLEDESKNSENVKTKSESKSSEEVKHSKLWRDAEILKNPWYDAPPKVKENKSRKVLKEDGLRQIAKLEKAVAWEFLWWSRSIPINLIVDENKKDLTANYKKEKMMFMKVFEGSWKVNPLYVDSKRLCKHMEPKSLEEYKKCSGGQGKIASKVIMNQYFQPYPLFNLPPFSWYIQDITIKTTETMLEMLQYSSIVYREVH